MWDLLHLQPVFDLPSGTITTHPLTTLLPPWSFTSSPSPSPPCSHPLLHLLPLPLPFHLLLPSLTSPTLVLGPRNPIISTSPSSSSAKIYWTSIIASSVHGFIILQIVFALSHSLKLSYVLFIIIIICSHPPSPSFPFSYTADIEDRERSYYDQSNAKESASAFRGLGGTAGSRRRWVAPALQYITELDCNVVPFYIMSCYVMLCYSMLSMSCYVML